MSATRIAYLVARGAMIGELGDREGGSGNRSGAWRSKREQRGSSRRVARKQSGERLVTEGGSSRGLILAKYLLNKRRQRGGAAAHRI